MRGMETALVLLSTKETALSSKKEFYSKQICQSTYPSFCFPTVLIFLLAFLKDPLHLAQLLDSGSLQPLISKVLPHPFC